MDVILHFPLFIVSLSVCVSAAVEGKAGMAAIAHEGDKFDLDVFLTAVQKALPSYACPVFLQLMPSVDTTGESAVRKGMKTHTFIKSNVNSPLNLHPQALSKFRRCGCRAKDTSRKTRVKRFIF